MANPSDPQGANRPSGDANLIGTDYEIGQDNVEGAMGPFGFDIHNPVFMISKLSISLRIFHPCLAGPDKEHLWLVRPFLTSTFDWFFLGAANIFAVFCLFLIVSPWHKVRLGGKDGKPDYGYVGRFAMLSRLAWASA